MSALTDTAEYHVVSTDDQHFKQDILSYLHAFVIIDKIGFATRCYKEHIARLLPRIEKHLPTRNASVQLMGAYYLRTLGFETQRTTRDIYNDTLLSRIEHLGEVNVFDFNFNSRMLGICHEVFALTEYGNKTHDVISKKVEDELIRVVGASITQIVSSGDTRFLDLLAEMIVALNYLNCENSAKCDRGRRFIINHQMQNGSFGDYEAFRSYFSEQNVDINIKWYLHTTVVCLWALLVE